TCFRSVYPSVVCSNVTSSPGWIPSSSRTATGIVTWPFWLIVGIVSRTYYVQHQMFYAGPWNLAGSILKRRRTSRQLHRHPPPLLQHNSPHSHSLRPPSRLHWSRSLRRSEEHTSELQSRFDLVCRLLLVKKKQIASKITGCASRLE